MLYEVITPSVDIIKMYKSLGGEIITFGSDAHKPDRILGYYKETMEILKTIGFKYLSTYTERKLDFVKI